MKARGNERGSRWRRAKPAIGLLVVLLLALTFQLPNPELLPPVQAQPNQNIATISPSTYWGPFFGTRGDVQVDVNRTGIAVRVEIPREFLGGVVSGENDTHFIQSNIRNDYYYYNVIDEAEHWSYGWRGNSSDAPCFKPQFSIYDPNAPWCVEIWNYLNNTFLNFTPPKFVRFVHLRAPPIAGIYNFTVFVANITDSFGRPDFVHAWNTTLFVPVSMNDNPASIAGTICDADNHTGLDICSAHPIMAKGVVYARNVKTNQMARAYVNATTGFFNLTGLAPGTYEVRGSAGIFNGVAYSLSRTDCSPPGSDGCYVQAQLLNKGETRSIGNLRLKRAPQVCGIIDYQNSNFPGISLTHSITDHPYLRAVGFDPLNGLNITVEASDSNGHTFRYQNVSKDSGLDPFRIITGSGIKYVGTDPYGTEFAGLPPTDSGSYQMVVSAWISGYLQRLSETVIVNTSPGSSVPGLCNYVAPNPVVMDSGGVITGTIQFWNLVALETPHQAEVEVAAATITDALFGGNILIQASDHDGTLRGIVLLNGTLPDGRTCYASPTLSPTCRIKITSATSIRFYIIGFSEYYNRTWAGVWAQRDYGLPEDIQGYSLTVVIRGYEQYTTPLVWLPRGGNSTVTVRMTRGGAIHVGVISYNNRPGMRVVQAVKPFRFLNVRFPLRARVYFYDSADRSIGFVERLMVTGVPNGVDTSSSFSLVFAGQNWSIRELLFFGTIPTHVTTDSYTVKAFTLGYVQLGPVTTPGELAGVSGALVALLIGNDIGVTVPVFAQLNLFYHIPENDFVTGQAFNATSGMLAGAANGNLTAGIPTLNLTMFGFGGMFQGTEFVGQGHFFYVSPDGSRYYDYGFDVGNYTVGAPEFGFNRRFLQILPSPLVAFNDLFLGQGVFLAVISMARITQGTGANSRVMGWTVDDRVVPLSWVLVEATNSTVQRSVPTSDGRYDGVGALSLSQGTYNVTFSNPFLKSQTQPNFYVQWNGSYSLLPPQGYLCPNAGIGGVCDPPAAPPLQASATGLALEVKTRDAPSIPSFLESPRGEAVGI